MRRKYKSQAARDAQKMGYGNSDYWLYLDISCKETSEYFKKRGNNVMAKKVLTQSLSEALAGNDGE